MAEDSDTRKKGPPDWILLGAVVALIAVGLMMVYSSSLDVGYREYEDSAYFFKRQLMWLGIGAVAMFVASSISYRHLTKVSILIMAVALIMLIALVIAGEGARMLIGQSVSPVELAKLAVVIYIGHWLASKRVEQLRRLPVGPLPFAIIVGIVAGLVMAQPDISEALVIVLVAVAMYFLAGAHLFQFVVGIAGGTAAFFVVARQLPSVVNRLTPFLSAWRDPLSSTLSELHQLRQGLIALGSGGVLGLGPGSGRMSYNWVPYAHTDAIFTILGEELGLIGCLTVIGLFAVVAYRGFRIALNSPDAFGGLLAVGITCWITFQALINTAVVTGTIPYSGITLPFISVGGSSLVTCMAGVGIVLSISRVATEEGALRREVGRVRRRDRRARVSSPDGHRSPA
jgi:cell division protein FtsW